MTAILRPEQRHLRSILSLLSSSPGEHELREGVVVIADAVEGKRYPKKAIGAMLRNHGGGFAPRLRARIAETVVAEVEGRAKEHSLASTVAAMRPWLTLKQAAQLLGVSERTLDAQLCQRDGRRRRGWPQWDGRQWHLAPQAIDPATAAVFLANLPAVEPLADLLPARCDR